MSKPRLIRYQDPEPPRDTRWRVPNRDYTYQWDDELGGWTHAGYCGTPWSKIAFNVFPLTEVPS